MKIKSFNQINEDIQLPFKKVFEERVSENDIDTEDGGSSKILEISNDEESGLFIRLHSWDENKKHVDFSQLVNRLIKITIETID